MKPGDTCWSWVAKRGGLPPVRPRLLRAAYSGSEELGLYDGNALILWADEAAEYTAPTEAEALEKWRNAVRDWVGQRAAKNAAVLAEAGIEDDSAPGPHALTLSEAAEEAMALEDDDEGRTPFGGSSNGFWYDVTEGGYFDWRAVVDPKDHARVAAAIETLKDLEGAYNDLTGEF